MGVLSPGPSYDWRLSRSQHAEVRRRCVRQFLHAYAKHAKRKKDAFRWGDEIEHQLINLNQTTHAADDDSSARSEQSQITLCLRACEVLKQWEDDEAASTKQASVLVSSASSTSSSLPLSMLLQPEYGRWHVEATPLKPYGDTVASLLTVEPNMEARREKIISYLKEGSERLLTITTFPLLGVSGFIKDIEEVSSFHDHDDSRTPTDLLGSLRTGPTWELHGPVFNSDSIPDGVLTHASRYQQLSKSVLARRGKNVEIRVPLFMDEHTLAGENDPKEIQMDCIMYAAGACCIQVTQQGSCLEESRSIYDLLTILAPLMLSITAATPFHKGRIAATDTRWEVLTQALDDRRDEEKPSSSPSPPSSTAAASPTSTMSQPDFDDAFEMIHSPTLSTPTESFLLQPTPKSKLPQVHPIISPLSVEDGICSSGSSDDTSHRGSTCSDVSGASTSRSGSIEGVSVSSPRSDANATTGFESRQDDSHERIPHIHKSRWSSPSTFISQSSHMNSKWNNIPCELDMDAYQELLDRGIDERLSRHISHLLIRDPLFLYPEQLAMADHESTALFDVINSTNWHTVKLKAPPATPGDETTPEKVYGPDSLGWRVEFRIMEVQLTSFENAAFAIFVILLTRAVLYFKIDYYMHLSEVDENIQKAYKMDSVRKERFHWRMGVGDSTEEQSLEEIFLGEGKTVEDVEREAREEEFTSLDSSSNRKELKPRSGLVPLIHSYLTAIGCITLTTGSSTSVRFSLNTYLSFITHRASGRLVTLATWMRSFVSNHPNYAKDSKLNQSIVADLIRACDEIAHGKRYEPSLMGQFIRLESQEGCVSQRKNSEVMMKEVDEIVKQDRNRGEVKLVSTSMVSHSSAPFVGPLSAIESTPALPSILVPAALFRSMVDPNRPICEGPCLSKDVSQCDILGSELLQAMAAELEDMELQSGVCWRLYSSTNEETGHRRTAATASSHCASIPMVLLPLPIPRRVWEHCRTLSTDNNLIYTRIARNISFLASVLELSARKDEFLAKQIQLMVRVYGGDTPKAKQHTWLMLNRNDLFMSKNENCRRRKKKKNVHDSVHENYSAADTADIDIDSTLPNSLHPLSSLDCIPIQVEFNIGSCGGNNMGYATQRIQQELLKKYLVVKKDGEDHKVPHQPNHSAVDMSHDRITTSSTDASPLSPSHLCLHVPYNHLNANYAVVLHQTHQAWIRQQKSDGRWNPNEPQPIILIITQEKEVNMHEHKALQFELYERFQLQSERWTLTQIHKKAKIDEAGDLTIPYLGLTTGASGSHRSDHSTRRVSVVYYRAGYCLSDFPSADDSEWSAYEKLELSTAIKAPPLPCTIAGMKKVQELLCQETILKEFVAGEEEAEGTIGENSDRVKSSFGPGASLSASNRMRRVQSSFTGCFPPTESILNEIRIQPDKFILKPQKEGGGHCLFGDEMLEVIRAADWNPSLLQHFTIMHRISPVSRPIHIVRYGQIELIEDGVTEVGFFGGMLSSQGSRMGVREIQHPITGQRFKFDIAPPTLQIEFNRFLGTVAKTKSAQQNEGGIMKGYGAADSVLIYDD